MRTLITGGGFVGQWLARALLARGDAVHFAGLAAIGASAILGADEARRIEWHEADFRRTDLVEDAVEKSRPDLVIHLAGISFPPEADRNPDVAFDVNSTGVVRLLAAIDRRRSAGTIDPVVIVVGSGQQYGRHDASEMPLDESAELRPVSVYAASKASQEIAALHAFRRSGVRVVCVRSFNHSGVGHAPQYLIPSLIARAKRIRDGQETSLRLGNDVIRDYLHVTDVVSAYLLLAERGRAGTVYNVASGHGVSVRQLAADVLLRVGVSAEISTEPALVRASDIPTLIGSPARLQHDTGWRPTRTHADIIDDLLHAEAD